MVGQIKHLLQYFISCIYFLLFSYFLLELDYSSEFWVQHVPRRRMGMSGYYTENNSGQHFWSLPSCLPAKTHLLISKKSRHIVSTFKGSFLSVSNTLYFSSFSQMFLPCWSYASIFSVSFKILLNLLSSRICMTYLDVSF